ncbi:MAG: hypothetical protein V1870_04520 [Candidatus Aenigmatarchaeota archaeon]
MLTIIRHGKRKKNYKPLDDAGFAVLAASAYAIIIIASDCLSQYPLVTKEVDKFISGLYSF